MALTPKKRRFIDALRGGASNKAAAIAAGYSEKTASAAGSRLAKDKDVLAELGKNLTVPPFNKDVKGTTSDPPPPSAPSEPGDSGFNLLAALLHRDPKSYLTAVMNDSETETKIRVDAAKALMPFVHQRKGEGGKKETAKDKAKEVASRFGPPPAPPNLRAVPGGKP